MPLNFATEVNLATPITATAVNITGFNVNVEANVLDIIYQAGNYDNSNPPVFIPIREIKVCNIHGADFIALLAANPTLYPMLKDVLYSALTQKTGFNGTIV